jgi:hypothetical protein
LFANRTFYNKFVKPAKNPEKLIKKFSIKAEIHTSKI